MKRHIKVGDEVQVIKGKDAAGNPRTGPADEVTRGRVRQVLRAEGRVIVQGVHMITKATRPDPRKGHRGGFVEREAPIHISNVMLVCKSCDRPVRVGAKVNEEGKKVRVCKKCGSEI